MKTTSDKQVTIYCSSSNEIPAIYFSETEKAIRKLTERGYGIRYGGGDRGLMGTVANTALKHGGKITGIIPVFMIEREWEHKGITELIHVKTMHERKALLLHNSCAVIAFPGGVGTIDELFDAVSLKKLGFYPYPIIIFNINNYFDPLNKLMLKMTGENFLDTSDDLLNIAASADEIIEIIETSFKLIVNRK